MKDFIRDMSYQLLGIGVVVGFVVVAAVALSWVTSSPTWW